MIIYYNFIFVIFIFGVYSFISYRKHLLAILLSLEVLVLNLFIILVIFYIIIEFEVYFTIIFLTFSVCEGVLGLSILISIIRTHGNDYFNNFSILQC